MVRAAVQDLAMPHATSSHQTVTVSVGVACARPNDRQHPGDLIEAADASLYAAKRHGRNVVAEHGLASRTADGGDPVALASWLRSSELGRGMRRARRPHDPLTESRFCGLVRRPFGRPRIHEKPHDSMTSERYNARESEPRWQRQWDEKAIFAAKNDDPRPKYYVLEMFPYPSGRIHIGHVRNYTLGDVLARFMRAKGFNVLHPMGWDAFGLPAENAAIERKVAPKAWTYDNIAAMKKQLRSIGLSLDWSREFATCDPGYYKHQQKMFNDFLRAGLAEREKRKINWDPVDMTVLANEQVIDGRGWRSGAVVEQREMNQWVFKITKYSQELLDALDTLDRWPDKVRLMQRNWIGRSRRPAGALRARPGHDARRRDAS